MATYETKTKRKGNKRDFENAKNKEDSCKLSRIEQRIAATLYIFLRTNLLRERKYV